MAITRSQQAKQLLALGGRIGLQEGGGIEQRLEQLGGDVTSAEQMLQGINKRLKTAESSLGSGGGLGDLPGMPTNLGIFGGVRPVDIGGVPQPIPPSPDNPLFRPGADVRPGAAVQDLATQVVQSPQQDPNIFGYDPSGSASVQDAYSTAQQAAEKARKEGFALKLKLPGEMSFEDFSNMFGQGGLQPLKSAQGDLGFPTLESINQFGKLTPVFNRPGNIPGTDVPYSTLRGGGGSLGIPAAGYADGGRIGLQGGGRDSGRDRGPETGREAGPVGGGKGVGGDNRDRRRTEQYKEVPKKTIKSGKDFRDIQKVEEAFTKKTIFDKFPSTIGLAQNFSKFNPELMKEFARFKSNQDLLDYINSLDEEDQSSGKLASALNLVGYGDFLAEQKGLPGLKFSGDVGGLEQFVKEDGTFDYSRAPGEGGQPIIPIIPQASGTTNQEPEEEKLSPKSFRFFNKGGIADTVVGGEFDFESARQMYGLGKLVKKATRTIKKIAKSPIGKAALLYGAGSLGLKGLGQYRAGTGIFSPTGFLKSKALPFLVGKAAPLASMPGTSRQFVMGPATKGILGAGGRFDPFRTILGASVLAGLTAKEEEDDTTVQTANLGPGLTIPENQYRFFQEGGSTEKEPVAKKTMPLLDMGGMEKDYREDGGFVPIGRMEKADDVPARLSKNEFVFTADAVRNAGDGNVDKGAEVMYNMMKNLEAGGEVSEESQGLEGARRMFQTSQRLEEVL